MKQIGIKYIKWRKWKKLYKGRYDERFEEEKNFLKGRRFEREREKIKRLHKEMRVIEIGDGLKNRKEIDVQREN